MFINDIYYEKVSPCDGCGKYHVSRRNDQKYDTAKMMHEVAIRCFRLFDYLDKKYIKQGNEDYVAFIGNYDMNNVINNLKERFDASRLFENDANNLMGTTAYTDDKKYLYLCMRDKNGHLYDINTLLFVALHELSHMAKDSWGHNPEYWRMFKLLLHNAREAGIYVPTDYARHNINYCGIDLTSNPYYDK